MESKNYYSFKFNLFDINLSIPIFYLKKNGGTTYKLLIWSEDNIIYFKYGKVYGWGSCWETILPNNKTGLIKKK